MNKKRILLATLLIFALAFMALAGCTVTPSNPSSDSEESIESIESVESEESVNTSESQSEEVGEYVIPTFALTNITSTATTISFDVEEEDPDGIGEITSIKLENGSTGVEYEDLSTRTFDGLLSGVQYTIKVTYTYNAGNGDVSKEYKKTKYTIALRAPEIELSYEATSQSSIAIELDIKDPSDILVITTIKLVAEDGEEICLDDISAREFVGLENGFYELFVEYEYDMNKGAGVIQESVSMGVATQINPLIIPDFVVPVEEGRNPVILQITDTQIIDSSQNTVGISVSYYAPQNFGIRLENYLRETVNAVQPDLIIMTGDNIYGKFDNSGASLLKLIEVMESFEIPWAPVFGNHDNESAKGVAWQCQQFEDAEYCLFKRGEVTGNGNYTVGIEQGGVLTRVFFMMDSNGCGSPSAQSIEDGISTYPGFAGDQIEWFESVGALLDAYSPETKVSFAFHIQIHAFKTAFTKYGHSNANKVINIDQHPDLEEGDMGYIGDIVSGTWDNDDRVYNKMVAIGADSFYVGHEHNMSASVVYNGVRFQFGQKIGTYDAVNWLLPDNSVRFAFSPNDSGDPIMGGSVNVLDETGAIVDAYIYFCGGISHNGRA